MVPKYYLNANHTLLTVKEELWSNGVFEVAEPTPKIGEVETHSNTEKVETKKVANVFNIPEELARRY